MNSKLKRPPSVWIAQTVIMLFAVFFIFSLLVNIAFGLGRGVPVLALLLLCAVNLGIVLLFLAAFWGLAKRKNYGRWLGVGTLSLIWLLMLLGQLFRAPGPVPYYEYTNTTQVIAATVATVVFNALFLLLIFRLAFAKSVKDFFQPPAATFDVPPAPPTFT